MSGKDIFHTENGGGPTSPEIDEGNDSAASTTTLFFHNIIMIDLVFCEGLHDGAELLLVVSRAIVVLQQLAVVEHLNGIKGRSDVGNVVCHPTLYRKAISL